VIRLVSLANAAGSFLLRRPRDLAIVILALLAIALAIQVRHERHRLQEVSAQAGTLPPGTQQVVTVWKDRIITKTQVLPGKVEYRDQYLPREGSATIYIRKDVQGMVPAPVIKDRGFTLRPGGGIVFSGRLMPEGDVKWFYFRRYSLLGVVSPEFGAAGFSRHVDDLAPFANLEVMGLCGVSWHGDFRLGIGLRSNF